MKNFDRDSNRRFCVACTFSAVGRISSIFRVHRGFYPWSSFVQCGTMMHCASGAGADHNDRRWRLNGSNYPFLVCAAADNGPLCLLHIFTIRIITVLCTLSYEGNSTEGDLNIILKIRAMKTEDVWQIVGKLYESYMLRLWLNLVFIPFVVL